METTEHGAPRRQGHHRADVKHVAAFACPRWTTEGTWVWRKGPRRARLLLPDTEDCDDTRDTTSDLHDLDPLFYRASDDPQECTYEHLRIEVVGRPYHITQTREALADLPCSCGETVVELHDDPTKAVV